MKFTKILCLICLVLMGLTITALGAEAITASILNPDSGLYEDYDTTTVGLECDGEILESDMPAILLDGRTMVPVRIISEKLGCAVSWDNDAQMVTIETADTTILLTIGDPMASVNGEAVALYDGVAPVLVNIDGGGRTMVPLRFISEQLKAEVDWDDESQTAIIATYKPYTADINLPVTVEDSLFIGATGDWTPRIFELSDRVVIDFPGGLFVSGVSGRLDLENNPAIVSVRYNQYDNDYEDFARVVRVVLDMAPGCDLTNLEILQDETGVTVVVGTLPEVDEDMAVEPDVDTEVAPEPEFTVMLDPGHGGTEVSATHFGVDEKTVTLPIALKVGELLEAAGIGVSYTRTEDVKVSLQERVDMANTADTDIYVSIHANAYPQNSAVVGIETFYLYDGDQGKTLAQSIQSAIVASTGANNRGAKEAGYYVIKNTIMPAVLVETGFLTNEAECMKLTTDAYQWQLAEGIAQGIFNYFGI